MSAGGDDVDEIVRLLTEAGVRCTRPNKDKRNHVYSCTMQRVPGECIRGHDDKYRNPRDCGKCARELKAAQNGGPPPSPIINPPLAKRMTALGVRGDKHIPPLYLRASKAQRLALLQGIMDTDGCVTDRGACIVMTSIPRLRDGIMELLRSLGYKPTAGEFVPKGGKTAWRIHFHPYSDQPVFRLSRKAARLRHPPCKAPAVAYPADRGRCPGRVGARSLHRGFVGITPVLGWGWDGSDAQHRKVPRGAHQQCNE